MAKKNLTQEENVSVKSSSKGLQETVKEIRERLWEGSIMALGDAPKVDVEAIPTGSISLDLALGVGGIPKGRIVEIYGRKVLVKQL